MSAKTWLKVLSIIALLFAAIDLSSGIYSFATGDILALPSITIMILAITAVIISFRKK